MAKGPVSGPSRGNAARAVGGSAMRGYFKKLKRQAQVRAHIAQHGGFSFHGGAVDVPDDLHLRIRAKVASGEYEATECELIEAFLPSDRPVVELGGCLGLVSNVIARRLKPGTPFVVVEANPALHEICQRNATLDGAAGNVQVESAAIAYDGADVIFDVSDNVHVSRLAADGAGQGVRVPARTLAEVLAAAGITGRYSLICDIEGAELDLIDRDANALGRCDLLVIEMHPVEFEKAGRSLEEMVAKIERLGLVERKRMADVFAFERAAGTA